MHGVLAHVSQFSRENVARIKGILLSDLIFHKYQQVHHKSAQSHSIKRMDGHKIPQKPTTRVGFIRYIPRLFIFIYLTFWTMAS